MWDCWVLVTHRYFQNQLAGADETVQVMQLSSRRSSMRISFIVLFRFSWSVVEPSWDDRGSSIWGYLIFIWILTVVGLCVYFGWCMIYIYVLCEVAIVSQLFIPFLFITWDVSRLPLLRQACHAAMPLSRAPTRGRYSRIVGVTSWYQNHPRLRSPLLHWIADIVESRIKCLES